MPFTGLIRKKEMKKQRCAGRLKKVWRNLFIAFCLCFMMSSCVKNTENDLYLDLEKWQKTGKVEDKQYKGIRYKNFTMDRYACENKWNVPRIAQTPMRAIWELADPAKPDLSIVGVVLWDKTHGKCENILQEKNALDLEFKRVHPHLRILAYESRITKKFGIEAVEYELTAVANPDKDSLSVKPMKIYSRGYRFVWPKGGVDRFCAEFTERGPVLSGRTLLYAEDFFRAIRFLPEK